MNLPNLITLSRIPMMFAVVWLMRESWVGAATIAFWLFIVAAVGDWLDGYLARKQKLISTFGKYMDALSDKIFVLGLMMALVDSNFVSIYWVLIVLCREFIVSGLRMIAAAKNVVIAAERGGKMKTLTQLIAIGFILAEPMFRIDLTRFIGIDFAEFSTLVGRIGWWLFVISVFFTVRSGVDYVVKYRKLVFD